MTDLKKYQEELEKCSKCGFCQAFCPVYAVTGRETEVARGRNAQLLGFAKGDLSISEIDSALSTCLLCRACVPSCFTGVKTDELVRAGREAFIEAKQGGIVQEIVFNTILPYPERMAVLLKFVYFLKKIGLGRLASRVESIPGFLITQFPRHFLRYRSPEFTKGKTVAYFRSCGFNYLLPEAGEATIRLIQDMGYDVIIPENNCCGLPPYAHGYTDVAMGLARRNIDALEKYDVILTECGSCSSFLKEYAKVLSGDAAYSERAKRLSERVVDSNEFICMNLQSHSVHRANTRFAPTKVTYHDPCHLSRYQGITKEPREIIKSIPGVEFIELPEADWCCGGAGTYSITNNDISMKILERKMNNLKKTGAEVLVTSCPACMIQLAYGVKRAGLNVRVMHLNQLFNLTPKSCNQNISFNDGGGSGSRSLS